MPIFINCHLPPISLPFRFDFSILLTVMPSIFCPTKQFADFQVIFANTSYLNPFNCMVMINRAMTVYLAIVTY